MADALITDVMADAAALLGDPAQEQFTNSVLTPWFGFTFREAFQVFQEKRLAIGKREARVIFPAYNTTLVPSVYGITDFGEPEEVWERAPVVTATITGVSNATPVQITAANHGLGTNEQVDIVSVTGPTGVNGTWFVTVIDANNFTLNGSVAGGVYSGGGKVITSSAEFYQLNSAGDLPQLQPSNQLRWWKWENQQFYFIGATTDIELRLRYTSDGNVPASGNVGLDGCRNYFGLRIASMVAPEYDMPQRGADLKMQALGPKQEADGSGGALRRWINPMILEKQNRIQRPGTFRPRRNLLTRNPW